MELKKIIIGETLFSNKIEAFQTEDLNQWNSNPMKWLYLVGGIHGDEVEGIFVLTQLLEWIKTSLLTDIPLILIPILNIDGYQANTRVNARKIDLNRNFPVANNRQGQKKIPGHGDNHGEALKEPESYYLKTCLDKYPPQLLITFHRTSSGVMVPYGETAALIGEFLTKYNRYPLRPKQEPLAGTLEAFVFDFYLSPVVSLKVGPSGQHKSFKDIWNENSDGLKQLLRGQAI
jgi:protein MpaA